MPAADLPSSYLGRRSAGDRAGALALSIAITALIVLALLRLGVLPPIAEAPPGPTTLTLLPEGTQADTTEEKVVAAPARAKGGAPGKAATAKPVPAPPTPAPPPPPPVPPLNLIPLSHAEMAAADITGRPTRAQARAAAGDGGRGAADGSDDGDADRAGSGPHGERLYRADWYARPTDAQMATYLPDRRQSGWGEIACRTAPQYRVEDCQELGETPGSGLSRTLREAAWQFKVLPPRIGGKPQIGVWVRIHFDFSVRGAG